MKTTNYWSLSLLAVSAGSVSAKTDAAGAYQIEVDKKGTIVSYSQALTKKAAPVKVVPATDKATKAAADEAASESVFSKVIDNIGKTTSVSEKISFKMKEGRQVVSLSSGVTGGIEAKLMTALMNTFKMETSGGTESITAEKYGSVTQSIEKEQGNMKPEHN